MDVVFMLLEILDELVVKTFGLKGRESITR